MALSICFLAVGVEPAKALNEVKRVVHTSEGAKVYYVSVAGGRIKEEALKSELIK